MNEYNADWEKLLKATEPAGQRTFTTRHMLRIEREAKGMNEKRSNGSKGRMAAVLAGALALIVLVTGILPAGPYTGWLRNDQSRTAGQPNDGQRPNTNEASVPHEERTPDEQSTPDDPKKAIEPQPPAQSEPLIGLLREQLPFDIDRQEGVSVHRPDGGEDIELSVMEQSYLMQTLYGLDFEKAKAPASDERQDVYFRIRDGGSVYEIPYEAATNTILWKGQPFYANENTLLLMHRLLEPESKLAEIAAFRDEQQLASDRSEVVSNDESYDADLLQVDGKLFPEWETEAAKLTPKEEIGYFDDTFGEARKVVIYEEGVIAMSLSYFFVDDRYRTDSGVGLGSTEAELLENIGEPNSKSAVVWSYRWGDYLRVHFYIKDGKVALMYLTQPM
ncbi:hypothetical protein [Paenibacillus methanolicus]|uniref:Uncharacterized protein n=1 Tax=Paenibacillus methanolicus TaxID=582686 RepID=A0A5S5C8G2_9BACL|nr:hypothetical protein [Paenibacillus methanolicus]TYP74888.1 hypothetical protein BCM02_105435 [Paenibacillus methanolicus]